jgi:hypothetical protein
MTLKIYTNKNGKVIKKGVPLNNIQIKELTDAQNEYINTPTIKEGIIYGHWSKIPYIGLRDANSWVANKIGYQTFDGYKIILSEKGIEHYIAQNLPEMQHALSDLVQYKITNTTRKGIGNINQDTRIVLARELNSNRNKLKFKDKDEEE